MYPVIQVNNIWFSLTKAAKLWHASYDESHESLAHNQDLNISAKSLVKMIDLC